MIRKQDILDRVGEWKLRPDVVEKDYVLGWLLSAFALNAEASRTWVFKGGTCLKKCFFETYRFSEDLDFSLTADAAYDETSLMSLVADVAREAAELSGIDFPTERIEVKERRDKSGRTTFEGKVFYQGPLGNRNLPRVLLDITRHEPIVAAPVQRTIFHPYPDELPTDVTARCYSLEELFAEKTRALLERTRPRDLYDVVQLWERRADVALGTVRDIFARKCGAKRVAVPTSAALCAVVRGSTELSAEWGSMLAHQLPSLPEVDRLLARLDEVLGWIDGRSPTPAVPPVPSTGVEALVAPRGGRFWGRDGAIEIVRFAGANRLKIAFDYDGKLRIAEPYSLRRRSTGNLLLYAWENGARNIKAFTTSKMLNVRVTTDSFVPRFAVELTG